jgi:hypothetical protein
MDIFELCRLVARSLFAEIGPWGDKCALIGGLIPGLLTPEPADGSLAPHIGTRDVDLAIRVAATIENREMYRTLKQNLANLGLEQSGSPSFEWRRTVENVEVVVELFVPVDDADQGGQIQKKPIEQSGSGLTALGIYGLEYIERDTRIVMDEGPLLDGKGIKNVPLRVCGPAVLLCLKAWALNDRTKTKDGYDVVWLLRAHGTETLAERFKELQLIDTDFGARALEFLEDNFMTHEHSGPMGWVKESQFAGEDAAFEARQAAGVVGEFLQLVRS